MSTEFEKEIEKGRKIGMDVKEKIEKKIKELTDKAIKSRLTLLDSDETKRLKAQYAELIKKAVEAYNKIIGQQKRVFELYEKAADLDRRYFKATETDKERILNTREEVVEVYSKLERLNTEQSRKTYNELVMNIEKIEPLLLKQQKWSRAASHLLSKELINAKAFDMTITKAMEHGVMLSNEAVRGKNVVVKVNGLRDNVFNIVNVDKENKKIDFVHLKSGGEEDNKTPSVYYQKITIGFTEPSLRIRLGKVREQCLDLIRKEPTLNEERAIELYVNTYGALSIEDIKRRMDTIKILQEKIINVSEAMKELAGKATPTTLMPTLEEAVTRLEGQINKEIPVVDRRVELLELINNRVISVVLEAFRKIGWSEKDLLAIILLKNKLIERKDALTGAARRGELAGVR